MFQIDHSREFVVVHEIVFLELKVIGAAQRFFRAAQEFRTAYRAYLLINAAENFCNNADTLVGFQFFDVAADFLKTAPKGFPKDFKYIDYLKCKEYVCSYNVPDDFFTRPDMLEQIDKVFRQFKRFADFINYTIDDFE